MLHAQDSKVLMSSDCVAVYTCVHYHASYDNVAISAGTLIAERLSARLLILQCMFLVDGMWRHTSGMQFVTL